MFLTVHLLAIFVLGYSLDFVYYVKKLAYIALEYLAPQHSERQTTTNYIQDVAAGHFRRPSEGGLKHAAKCENTGNVFVGTIFIH